MEKIQQELSKKPAALSKKSGRGSKEKEDLKKAREDIEKQREDLKKEREDSKKERERLKKERVDLEKEREELKKEREDLKKQKEDASIATKQTKPRGNKIQLNVGGQIFVTSRSTLTAHNGSFFEAMFSRRWNTRPEEDGCYFIDRDPCVFGHVLNYLRGQPPRALLAKKRGRILPTARTQ